MKIDRNRVYKKCNGHCAYCGERINIKNMQIDHVIPKHYFKWHIKNKFKVPDFLNCLTEFDVNHIDNLMPSCRSCNNYKSTFGLELFRSELGKLTERLNKTSSIYRIAKRFGNVEETENQLYFILKN
jgi:5-methylcytosine-specific restriction endonuclease McrA